MSAPRRMWGLMPLPSAPGAEPLVVLKPRASCWRRFGNSGDRTDPGAGWALISVVHSAEWNPSLTNVNPV